MNRQPFDVLDSNGTDEEEAPSRGFLGSRSVLFGLAAGIAVMLVLIAYYLGVISGVGECTAANQVGVFEPSIPVLERGAR